MRRSSWARHVASQSAVQGIVAALLARERTGSGQLVETSLLRGYIPFAIAGLTIQQLRGRHPERFPPPPPQLFGRLPVVGYNPVPTSDGEWIQLASIVGAPLPRLHRGNRPRGDLRRSPLRGRALPHRRRGERGAARHRLRPHADEEHAGVDAYLRGERERRRRTLALHAAGARPPADRSHGRCHHARLARPRTGAAARSGGEAAGDAGPARRDAAHGRRAPGRGLASARRGADRPRRATRRGGSGGARGGAASGRHGARVRLGRGGAVRPAPSSPTSARA